MWRSRNSKSRCVLDFFFVISVERRRQGGKARAGLSTSFTISDANEWPHGMY